MLTIDERSMPIALYLAIYPTSNTSYLSSLTLLIRFDHMASLSKQVSPSRGGEEVQERALQLVTERQALREAWEKRNKKLKQCCELQVLDNVTVY